jgi:hypothetical protein
LVLSCKRGGDADRQLFTKLLRTKKRKDFSQKLPAGNFLSVFCKISLSPFPSGLYTDSQASIDLIANMFAMHPKCRHFNRDVNAVRQSIQQGIVELAFIGTDENPADLMTKLLGPAKHAKFTAVLLAGVGLVAVAALAYHSVIL